MQVHTCAPLHSSSGKFRTLKDTRDIKHRLIKYIRSLVDGSLTDILLRLIEQQTQCHAEDTSYNEQDQQAEAQREVLLDIGDKAFHSLIVLGSGEGVLKVESFSFWSSR